jgi:hypothetical protein
MMDVLNWSGHPLLLAVIGGRSRSRRSLCSREQVLQAQHLRFELFYLFMGGSTSAKLSKKLT